MYELPDIGKDEDGEYGDGFVRRRGRRGGDYGEGGRIRRRVVSDLN